MSSDQLAQTIIWVALFLLVSGPVHEAAHAYTAWKLGDGTAKLFGRVTLDPIKHFDPLGGLMLAFSAFASGGTFAFGWAKPTPVNPYNLRGRYADSMVAAAGPLSNLALAAVFGILFRVVDSVSPLAIYQHGTPQYLVALVCFIGVELNVVLMLFNLIPIPPLDGSHVLYDVLDPRTVRDIRPFLDQYGFFLLILLIIPLGSNGSILSALFGRVGDPIVTFLIGF